MNKPLIAGVVAVVAATVVAVVVFAGGGGDKDSSEARGPAETATQPPTQQPTRPPATSTPFPPTQAPAPTSAPPPPPPANRTCAEIRTSGTYLSDGERQFFLSSCQPTAAPRPAGQAAAPTAPPAPAAPQAAAPNASAEEETYRSRATAIVVAGYTKEVQFEKTTLTFENFRSEIASAAANLLNLSTGLTGIQPVPARFASAHDGLVAKSRAAYEVMITFDSVRTPADLPAWLARLTTAENEVNAAFLIYQLVTGVRLPSLR